MKKMVEYDSKTVGTKRKMQVYTPPGYSLDKKCPVLYLLHGIGGDETEWQRFATPNLLLDNLLANSKKEWKNNLYYFLQCVFRPAGGA